MEGKIGCGPCNGTGWIYLEREDGQPVVRPCTCRYEIAKKIVMIENCQTIQEIQARKNAEQIVKAYERHKAGDEENGKTKAGGE